MNSLGALGRDHHCTYKSDPFEGKKEEEEEKKGCSKKKKRTEREQKEIGRKQNKRVWVYNLPPCWVC